MKAEIKISVDGKHLHSEGHISLCSKTEAFELVCVLTDLLEIESPEDWAALALYGALRPKNQGHEEKTVIKIPNINKKENNYD